MKEFDLTAEFSFSSFFNCVLFFSLGLVLKSSRKNNKY